MERWDAMIGINHPVPAQRLEGGTFLMDLFGCPVFEIIVDPPYHYHDTFFESHMNNMYMRLLDEEYVAYCRTYYKPFKDIRMACLPGPTGEYRDYDKREIDVLFTGTLNCEEEQKNRIAELVPDWEWADEFYDLLIKVRIGHPEMTTVQAVIFLLEYMKIEYSDDLLKVMMSVFGMVSDYYVRAYYRRKIVTLLVDAGIRVHVAGNGWEDLYPVCPENLVLMGSVDFEKTADLIANAKILLNNMPSFKNGIHDRVLTAMQNGAVCVTDYSTYVDSHFQDGKELVFYRLEELEMLPRIIEQLLKNPDRAKKIAKRGQDKVQKEYTWEIFVKKYVLDQL